MRKLRLVLAAFTVMLAGTLTAGSAFGLSQVEHASKSLSIMYIGPSVSDGYDFSAGLQAEIGAWNAAGGIDGHHIQYVFCSAGPNISAETQDLAASCAQQAVSGGILALVGDFDDYDNATIPIAQAAHLPVIGEFSFSPIDFTSPDSTPDLSTDDAISGGIGLELATVGNCKRIGTLGIAGTATTASDDQSMAAGAKFGGAKVVGQLDVSSTVADFAPSVAILESDHADCIADDLSSNDTGPLLTAINDTGQQLKLGVNDTEVPQAVISAVGPSINGVYASQSALELAYSNNNPGDAETAGEKLMETDFRKYDPAALNLQGLVLPSYVAGYMFDVYLKKVISEKMPITGESLLKVMKDTTVASGVYPPTNFSKPGPIAGEPRVEITSVNFMVVKNSVLVPLSHKNYNVGPALVKYHVGT
jgi:ABC-type branched-subunit amino acid transport system substrate-binding protein